MTLREAAGILEATVVAGEERLDMELRSVCASDLMSDVLTLGRSRSLLLTGLTNPQAVRTAELADIRAVCLVRGKPPQRETVELARSTGIPLLRTPCSMYTACGRLYASGLEGCDG